jgi:hypothetical protein
VIFQRFVLGQLSVELWSAPVLPQEDDKNTFSPSRAGVRVSVENYFKDFLKTFDANMDNT